MGISLLPERHIILYAKGYYQEDRMVLRDAEKLVANYRGCDIKDLNVRYVFDTIYNLTAPYILKTNCENTLRNIFNGILNNFFSSCEEISLTMPISEVYETLVSKIIYNLLYQLGLAVMVVDKNDQILPKYGEPDPNVLPLYKTKGVSKNIGDYPFASGT
jgi:hypothetical protein